MNLLMLAHLRDINGKIRYVLGAQIDVSNLVPDSTELDGAASAAPQVGFVSTSGSPSNGNKKEDAESTNNEFRRPGVLLRGNSISSENPFDNDLGGWVNSKLSGFYQNVSF
jgi:hypothetical protein